MRVVITGGQGFIGQELCRFLLRQKALKDSTGASVTISKIVLFDIAPPRSPGTGVNADPLVSWSAGDITDPAVCRALVEGGGALSVFHLAGVMSGQAEQDFDTGLRVNLDGTRNMLEACRARGGEPARFIFASSMAVFGETYEPKGVPTRDTSKIVPKNTYGMTKACGELLVNDYSRKGFVDGRSARLPTVVVRPGAPNAATTSCYSGVVREPLHGVDVELPIARGLPHAVTSTRALIQNLATLHDVSWPEDLVDRSLTLPSRTATLQQLIDALHRAVPEEEHTRLGKITDKEDEFLSRVVGGMNSNLAHERAAALGMVEVPDLETIVREFLEDFGEGAVVSRGGDGKRRRVN
mmetsp:Transcript_37279/g.105246  ORF Transcript_37279/g.105246 Transcript_37279/m.105246 type:complete len:353 (-) Transcript_37279:301-1359(-)